MGVKQVLRNMIGDRAYFKYKEWQIQKQETELFSYLRENKKFENKYQGKRCFIFGNGPSLKSVDFSLFYHEYTFTVNQLPRNSQFEQLNTNFHMWSDERFFQLDKNRPEDMELLKVMEGVNTSTHKPQVFYKYKAKPMIEKFGLEQKLDISYYQDIGGKRINKEDTVDFTRLVPVFSTVVHYAICLAVFMGFQEIYLLGCDCTGFINTAQAKLESGEMVYSYEVSKNERKRMERILNASSFRNELSWYVEIFDEYTVLEQYCTLRNVKLYNATQPTLLESIPKVDLQSLF